MIRAKTTRRATLRIALHQWQLMWRDRTAKLGLMMFVLLLVMAIFTTWNYRANIDAQRQAHQRQINTEFAGQPDRHPHRMVHYGHFAMRTMGPLAAFDIGVEPYTGHTLYLEGHRQNAANFGDVRQSSLMLGFGQLTPAALLQTLAPLLLIFMGHGLIARERETGTLRLLLAQGVAAGTVVRGKLLALLAVALAMLLPVALALAVSVWANGASVSLVLALGLAYALWLAFWVATTVLVSAWVAHARIALVVLLGFWAFSVVMLPRLASEVANAQVKVPSAFETSIRVHQDLARIGDSHNPDDPYFAAFRQKVLADYGVARVEDLPVNYKGLIATEGERITSQLFDRYATAKFEKERAQLQLAGAFSALSPLIALRQISMAWAGTDLQSHHRFLQQAEEHRYQLIQALNRLQAEKLSFAGDRSSRDNRIGKDHWHGLAEFHHRPEANADTIRRTGLPALVLLAWTAVPFVFLIFVRRRLFKGAS